MLFSVIECFLGRERDVGAGQESLRGRREPPDCQRPVYNLIPLIRRATFVATSAIAGAIEELAR